jgi:hypothetical protein
MEEVFVQRFIPFIKPLFPKQEKLLATNLIHALHAKSQLIDQTLASLPAKLDQCWHAILLETDLYKEFCDTFCGGRFVRHTTTTQSTDVKVALLKALVVACGNEPGDWVWSSSTEHVEIERATKRSRPESLERLVVAVYVKTMRGTFTFRMRGNNTVYDLATMVSTSAVIPRDAFRLVWAGKHLDIQSSTLNELQIPDGATIHLVERLRGC